MTDASRLITELEAVTRERDAAVQKCEDNFAAGVNIAKERGRLQLENVKLRAGIQRVCDDTGWCPVCERHPGTRNDHSLECPMGNT